MNTRLQRFTTIALLGLVVVAVVVAGVAVVFFVSPYPFVAWLVVAALPVAVLVCRYAPAHTRNRWLTCAGCGFLLLGLGLYYAGARVVEVVNESGQKLELSQIQFDDYILVGGTLPDGSGIAASFHSLRFGGRVRVIGRLENGRVIGSLFSGPNSGKAKGVPSSTRLVRVLVLPNGSVRFE